MAEGKNSNGLGQIIAAIAIALLAGGTAPWWWDKLIDNETQVSPTTENPEEVQNDSDSSDDFSQPTEPSLNRDTSQPPSDNTPSDNIGVIAISWNDSPSSLGINKSEAEIFVFSCDANDTSTRLYGTEMYTGSSSICEAAVHTGVFAREQGGNVSIEVKGKQQSFKGSQRNGVLSRGYGSYSSSFIILP
ncbi:MAG: LCCL domain-containing protein [Cyanobacteria bacterium J06634_5]